MRPVIADTKAVEVERIVLTVYCPDKADDFDKALDGLKTDTTVRRRVSPPEPPGASATTPCPRPADGHDEDVRRYLPLHGHSARRRSLRDLWSADEWP